MVSTVTGGSRTLLFAFFIALAALAGGCENTDTTAWCEDVDEDGICDNRSCVDANNNGLCDDQEPCPPPSADTDGDGVCDDSDICPGYDDSHDFDFDGAPNGCDACPADAGNQTDADGDGVCDGDDQCEGHNDTADFDVDGVADGCDPCPLDNPDDSDGDGTCDVDDLCPGADDTLDEDGDGVPDACDPCPLDDPDDSDGDGICDSDDDYPLVHDGMDYDGDGVPDAEDPCPVDALDDSDGDGTCDSDDLCPGFDDSVDADGDGTPDECDTCPQDNPDDSDADTVCDSDDQCPGDDDRFDLDGDGVPNGCDDCPFDEFDDSDGDGFCDSEDQCPDFDDLQDRDGDGVADACDVCPDDTLDDRDGDGVCDSDDPCPDDYPDDTDGDGVCDSDDPCPLDDPDDTDGDGVCDSDDECPLDNPDDANDDGICDSEATFDPTVDWINPAAGSTGGGYWVEISGEYFQPGVLVEFGTEADGWVRATDTQVLNGGTYLRTKVPAYQAGLVDLQISNTNGRSSVTEDAFTYLAPSSDVDIEVTGLEPQRGPKDGGYVVKVSGQGFVEGLQVYFGHEDTSTWLQAPSVERVGSSLAKVVVPNWGVDETVDVKVVNPVHPTPEEFILYAGFEFGDFVRYEPFGQRLPNDIRRDDHSAVIFDANDDGLEDVMVFRSSDRSRDELYLQTFDDGGNTGFFVEGPRLPDPNGLDYRRQPQAVDIDADGDLDVAFIVRDRMGFYVNEGGGNFSKRTVRVDIDSDGTDFEFADLDCDGIDDILVTEDRDQNEILIGDGAGGYSPVDPAGDFGNVRENTQGVALADVDDDGDTDILLANYNAALNRLYYNNCANVAPSETWSFTEARYGNGENFPTSGFSSVDAAFHDVDGDGILDALILNNGQTLRVYLGDGSGNFANDEGQFFPQDEDNARNTEWWFGDVDLDGDTDMVLRKRVANDRYWPHLYLSDLSQGGSGRFTDVSDLNIPPRQGENSRRAAVGDLNADGLPDLYMVNEDDQDWLFINDGLAENEPVDDRVRVGVGVFANNTAWGFPETERDVGGVAIGDIDGDGDNDIVLGARYVTRDHDVWINEGGEFFSEPDRLPDVGCNTRDVELVDLNGDGDLDLLFACTRDYVGGDWYDGRIRQFVNDGAGVFTDVTSGSIQSNDNREYTDIAVGDIDNDGDIDMLVSRDHGFEAWISAGDVYSTDGAFFLQRNDLVPNHDRGRAVIVEDLNEDGFLDVYLTRSNQNRLLHNDGTGKMVDVTNTHLPAISDNSRTSLTHDLDKDGDRELFVVNDGESRLHFGELDYKFADATASALPGGMSADHRDAGLLDVDGDSLQDIVSAVWGGRNQLLRNIGGGDFANYTPDLPRDSDYTRYTEVADLDGNGEPDLFIANRQFHRIYLNFTTSGE